MMWSQALHIRISLEETQDKLPPSQQVSPAINTNSYTCTCTYIYIYVYIHVHIHAYNYYNITIICMYICIRGYLEFLWQRSPRWKPTLVSIFASFHPKSECYMYIRTQMKPSTYLICMYVCTYMYICIYYGSP